MGYYLLITSPITLRLLSFLPYASIAATGIMLTIRSSLLLIATLVGYLHLLLLGLYLVGIVGNHYVKVYTLFINVAYLLWSPTGVALLEGATYANLGVPLILKLFWLPQILYLVICIAIPSVSVIVPGKLLLGNCAAATSDHILRRYHVTSVLELCDDQKMNDPSKVAVNNLLQLKCSGQLDAPDGLIQVSKQAIDFINQDNNNNKGGVVLVHCSAGVSRSPAMVVQWLVSTKKVPSVQAGYDMVRKARPIVDVSKDHMDALKKAHHDDRKVE